MRTTLAFTGVTELILEKAVQLGLARSKTDALRMGVFALNNQYRLVKDIEAEITQKKSTNSNDNIINALGQKAVKLLENNKGVLAVIAFGSQVDGKSHAFSDVDLCLVMPHASEKTRGDTLLNVAGILPENYDVKIFEDLPLMLKGEVVKNGKTLFTRNENELHEYLWNWKKNYDDYTYQYNLAHTGPLERVKKWKKNNA
ncbi:MAG: nucleotidyltransferase domain-containing protein [Candidatus Micrarchaeota archaeon]|nr:nucleotidyltransferase domain-containing protein [Candidatus Micrarchaeota archaeon]